MFTKVVLLSLTSQETVAEGHDLAMQDIQKPFLETQARSWDAFHAESDLLVDY